MTSTADALKLFDAVPDLSLAAEVLLALPHARGRDLFLNSRRDGLQGAVITSATSERKEQFFTLLEPTKRLQVMKALPISLKSVLMPWLGSPYQPEVARGDSPAAGDRNRPPANPTTPIREKPVESTGSAQAGQSAARKSWAEAEAEHARRRHSEEAPELSLTPERPLSPPRPPPPAPKPPAKVPKQTSAPRLPPPPPKSHKDLAATWDRVGKKRLETGATDPEIIEEEVDMELIREDEEWEDELDYDPDDDRALFETLPLESEEEFAASEKDWKPSDEQPHRPFSWRWAEKKAKLISKDKYTDTMALWGWAVEWQYALRIRSELFPLPPSPHY